MTVNASTGFFDPEGGLDASEWRLLISKLILHLTAALAPLKKQVQA